MSQTVTGNALQFTDDNKHAYAYSGSKDISSTTSMLNFQTASEYIIGRFEFNSDFGTGGGALVRVKIYFNDVLVMHEADNSNDYVPGDATYILIIPPFTTVEVTCLGGAQDANVNFTGKVGMAQRVGNE